MPSAGPCLLRSPAHFSPAFPASTSSLASLVAPLGCCHLLSSWSDGSWFLVPPRGLPSRSADRRARMPLRAQSLSAPVWLSLVNLAESRGENGFPKNQGCDFVSPATHRTVFRRLSCSSTIVATHPAATVASKTRWALQGRPDASSPDARSQLLRRPIANCSSRRRGADARARATGRFRSRAEVFCRFR